METMKITDILANPICPSCGNPSTLPLVWGDLDLLSHEDQERIARGEAVCGGDAIVVDEQGRAYNMICSACDAEWLKG